jgi:peptidoglycan/xylan/chitin deacetylase (PgdA/CDA1 family)
MNRTMKRLAQGLLCAACVVLVGAGNAPPAPGPPLRVGVFLGNGASGASGENAMEALRIDLDIAPRRITANEIALGGLDDLDVLVFPGGSGSRQVNDLGAMGVASVREFIRTAGKGAVGLCAGAYLLTDTPDYACLRLCPLSAVDRDHDERGHGIVAMEMNSVGLEVFPELKGMEKSFLYYYEGPLMIPAASGGPYEVLGTFTSDVHLENGAPAGLMPGKPVLARAEAGKGRVFLCACHPEATPGMRWMVPRMVRWAARREAIPYSQAVVRPKISDHEIPFDEALRKEESDLFQDLLYGTDEKKAQAIRRLVDIRSWDGPRWVAGCLRSDDAPMRREAAKALAEWEATWVFADVTTALKSEKDPGTRATLEFASSRLRSMAPAVERPAPPGTRRQVAVTFDDLPGVSVGLDLPAAWNEMTARILKTLGANGVPAVGFVNAGKWQGADGEQRWKKDLLSAWLDAGMELGNHTYSHMVLHTSSLEDFEADIIKGDEALWPILAQRDKLPRFFRHPCLQTGRDEAVKDAVGAFLQKHGYTPAPVTIDNSEWIFAAAYAKALKQGDVKTAARLREAYLPYMESKIDYFERQSRALFGREVKQILLVHANALNADAFGGIIKILRDRGYAFITLDEALKDDAYALPDGYFGPAGISWLHRWCFALGGKTLVLPGEPRCPEWVMKEAGVESE